MNRQCFTRSLRINLSSISLFLFGHFFGLGTVAARTQYLAHMHCYLPPSLNHYITGTHTNTHTHTQHLLSLAASPTRLCLRSPAVSLDHPYCLCFPETQLCREVASQQLCGFQRRKESPTCYNV